ncbi:uncharacterized protein LOC130673395 [Microplitis mediator]|uniref:uncharacterized protein LOC130673395 n=1 Tax=Microplitis mediator TaxID=375433 RepID=UPI0025567130|nr:uncharacterized protein LOC130673395 [Microplitis mediator]
MQSSVNQELTMEEEIWLLEEMIQHPSQLILTPTPTATTSPLTSAPTTNARKTPDIRVREVQEVRLRLAIKPEPHDPTKPGFKRPTKRPVIRPASAAMIKLARPVKTTTNPGPLVTSGPQSTAELVGENPSGKPDDPTGANLDTGHFSSMDQPTNDDAFPARATASFPKKKWRIGGQKREEIATNPGPRARSPQLDATPETGEPATNKPVVGKKTADKTTAVVVDKQVKVSNTRPVKKKKGLATNPGPSTGNSPQLATTINAGWIDYDDAPLLSDYPEYFGSRPEDLFQPPIRVQTPLQRLLAALTPLAEVRPKTVAKRDCGKKGLWQKATWIIKQRALRYQPPSQSPRTPRFSASAKRPDIRIRVIQKTKLRLIKKPEPYDPAKPGFTRPAKRPLIRPASSALAKLARPIKAANPGPLVKSSPQLVTAKPTWKPAQLLEDSPPSSKVPNDSDDVPPTRASASFPKRKRRVGVRYGQEDATNPDPSARNSPQLGTTPTVPALAASSGPKRAKIATGKTATPTITGPGRKIEVFVTNPGPPVKSSPQFTAAPIQLEATWLEYDLTAASRIPRTFREQAGRPVSASANQDPDAVTTAVGLVDTTGGGPTKSSQEKDRVHCLR